MPQELKLTSRSPAQIAKIFKQCFFFFSVLVEQRTRPNTDVQLILESRWNSIHINPNHVVDHKLIFKKNSFHETKTHSREQQWSLQEK